MGQLAFFQHLQNQQRFHCAALAVHYAGAKDGVPLDPDRRRSKGAHLVYGIQVRHQHNWGLCRLPREINSKEITGPLKLCFCYAVAFLCA